MIATNGGLWGPSTVHRAIQAAAREAGYFVSSVNLPDVTREDLAARSTTCATTTSRASC